MTTKTTPCAYCGMIHQVKCPTVKAFEYHPDGTIKRVEFMTPSDAFGPMPSFPVVTRGETS